MCAKRSRFMYCVGVARSLKDWVCAVRGEFYGVLATEDERGKWGEGVGDVEEGTAGSLSAADEWAAMSHRIDAAPPPPAPVPAPRGCVLLACLLGLQITQWPIFNLKVAKRRTFPAI